MNILFVMKHRGNAGNTHAVAEYMRVGPRHGHTVALYGSPKPWLPGLRFSTDVRAFDHVAYLFESELYRVNRLQEVALLGTIPRRRRIVFDMDGMYNPVFVLDGYDRNHQDEASRVRWSDFYEALAGRVVKPTLVPPTDPRVAARPFYGYDPVLEMEPSASPPKRYDVLHVGHNWWRWKQVSEELLPEVERVRDRLGEIGFVGLWWDAPPPLTPEAGPAEAFRSDPEAFQRLRIHTTTAVMYHDVIRTMSAARVNIFTQRPVLRHLRHLTLKYFEIFYADTIPLLMLDEDLAAAVYGPAGRELTLPGRVADKLVDALRRPDHYRSVVREVRRHLAAYHSYDRRVAELAALLQEESPGPGDPKGDAQ